MKVEEKKYCVFISGMSGAALLFDKTPKDGGLPVLWLKKEWDQPQSVEGVHLGMVFQNLGDYPKIPPDFYHPEMVTAEEAKQLLDRECHVASIHLHLTYIAFDDGTDVDDELFFEMVRLGESAMNESVTERIIELGIAPNILKVIEMHRGENGIVKFRQYFKEAEAHKLEKLFFGE